MFQIKKAERQRRPLKISLEGLSGSGKTFTALRTAFAMQRAGIGKRIIVADSENESASLYAGVKIDGEQWDYEVCPIPSEAQNPEGYANLYEYLVRNGYGIIIIDSMSHAWHGAMAKVDSLARSNGNKADSFRAWGQVTPEQRRMIQTLTDDRAHLIATMRVKSEYERTENANGKTTIRKMGTKADQREGTEYEFDVVARLDSDHTIAIEKVRGCTEMDGRAAHKPGADFWQPLFDWWKQGADYKTLAEKLHEAVQLSTDMDMLKKSYEAAWNACQKGQITQTELALITATKDARKSEYASITPNDVDALIFRLYEFASDTEVESKLAAIGIKDQHAIYAATPKQLIGFHAALKAWLEQLESGGGPNMDDLR